MSDLVQTLAFILPIIAATLFLLIISVNIFFKIRRKFSINVNCWFCNSWTKVPYDERNSFNCPTCFQYNGFTKDGDYNRIIPEQHDELLNKITHGKNHKSVASNGLCALCNNNQQLKVFQLAHFVPLVEENYDVEIEHFQEQLEKAYKLCKKCDRVLKKTLDNQNAWVFGNKIKNVYNGITKVADQFKQETKSSTLTKIYGVFTILLVLTVIFITLLSIKPFTKLLSSHLPASYLSIYTNVVSVINTSHKIEISILKFTRSVKLELYSIVCVFGLSLQTLRLIVSQVNSTKVNQLLCWVILFLISWVRHNKNYPAYILFIEAFCCIYLLTMSFKKDEQKSAQKLQSCSMRKLVKNLETTCTDFSDFDNMSSFSNNLSRSSSNRSSPNVESPQKSFTANSVHNSSFTTRNTVDLHKSLDNLHLGFKSPKNALKRPKPVLSPPKFQNINPWVAGGFWNMNEGTTLGQRSNLSRSSSESSGFGSQHNENTQYIPPKSQFGEFDRLSVASGFTRYSPTYGLEARPVFYPNLQPNNMLLIHRVATPGLFRINDGYQRRDFFENWSDRINSQSFRDLSMNSNN